MEKIDIRLQGPIIKAEAGKKVTLRAEFDRPCWSCIHERRTTTTLNNRNGHDAFKHHTADSQSSLKRKFRIWRCDIPRDNYLVDLDTGNEIDLEKGIARYGKHPNDRMRNPWLYLKLMKKAQATMVRAEIHDIMMTYFN